jgi:hypothetical protein
MPMQFGAMKLQSKIPCNSPTYFVSNKLGVKIHTKDNLKQGQEVENQIKHNLIQNMK